MSSLRIFKHKEENNDSNIQKNFQIHWPDHVISLNEKNFEQFIKKYPYSIVDFWAPWCAPCKSMAPRLRRLSKIYKKRVAFAKIDIQKNKDMSKKYKISGIPLLIIFKYGKKISSITGLKSVGDIKNIIEDVIK